MTQRDRYSPQLTKAYIRRVLARLNENWHSEPSFIFIRTHRKDFRIIFVDELVPEEALRLSTAAIPSRFKESRHFGFYLRARRKGAGLTLKDLQRISGIPYQNLSAIENGRRNVGPRTRRRLEAFLGLASDIKSAAELRAHGGPGSTNPPFPGRHRQPAKMNQNLMNGQSMNETLNKGGAKSVGATLSEL
jgi:hypothetical protein